MKKIKVFEWKCLYPIKKIILLGIELFLVYISFRGIYKMRDFDSITDYLYWGCFILMAVILFPKVRDYLVVPYRCMPIFSQKMGYKKSAEMIQNENFVENEKLKRTLWERKFFISEHWICIENHLIPKNGIVKMWVTDEGIPNHNFYVGFLLITGEVFQRKVAVIPNAALIDDKQFIIKTQVALQEALQENTLGIGINSSKYLNKVELNEDLSLIKEHIVINKKEVLEAISKSDIQKEIVDLILDKNSMKPEFRNRIWVERWKTIPFYREYLDKKWWV